MNVSIDYATVFEILAMSTSYPIGYYCADSPYDGYSGDINA